MFFKPEDALKFDTRQQQFVLQQAAAAQFKVEGGQLTIQAAQAALDHVASEAVNRNFPWWKAMRPHDTIEAIRTFKVPDGDHSVGLEHEANVINGDDIAARKQIVDFLRNEDYVCIDSDGAMGRPGAKAMLEATFPPVLASTIGLNWAGCRYVDFIGQNKLVVPSTPETYNVGVHINMAKGSDPKRWCRGSKFGYQQNTVKNKKYFGRSNGFSMQCQGNGTTKWIEFRMFNTTEDPIQLLWYVECAKTLIDLMDAGKDGADMYDHLEVAYNKFFNVNCAVNSCRAAA